MKYQNRMDLSFTRLQNLILCKLILLVYTIYIWYTFDHYFQWYIYLGGMLVYFMYFIVGRNTIRKYSHIADFVLISLFLFGKHLNSFGFATYLLLPVVCRGTYFSNKNVDKYFALEYIAILLILCLLPDFDGWKGVVHLIIPAIIVLFINFLFNKRWDTDDFVAELLDLVDDFYTSEEPSYHLYRTVINSFSKRGVYISNIACFSSDENYSRLHLINSSSLIYRFQYVINDDLKNILNTYDYAFDAKISLDGQDMSKNIVYSVEQISSEGKKSKLLFVLFLRSESQKRIRIQIHEYERFFIKLSKVIMFENGMRARRIEEIQNLQQKGRFVNAAINTMHFIKNRLTPFQTLLDYLNNEGDIQKFDRYPILLENVKKSCSREMKDILQRAKFLLDKGNNPFLHQVLTETDSRSIFTLLRTIWIDTFSDEYDSLITIGNDRCCVPVNIEGMDVLFSDIIGNMKKYSKKNRLCKFDVTKSKIKIIFSNDFADLHAVESLVNYINSDEKNEVFFRVTHGTPLIKQNCKDQNIEICASITKDTDALTLYNLSLIIKSIEQ